VEEPFEEATSKISAMQLWLDLQSPKTDKRGTLDLLLTNTQENI
jgi:hypothetical protein